MDLIFGRKNAEKLREKYTILDLETITKDGITLEVFCLLSAEKIGLMDLPKLEQWTKLHNDFLDAYNKKQYAFCRQCVEHLMGKFGGELDTFYEEIMKRINQEENPSKDKTTT